MRLDRFLAESGAGHKRNVRLLISSGNVKVNDIVEILPYREVDEHDDRITLNDIEVQHTGVKYYMFNKPQGCITANKDDKAPTVFDYFPDEDRDKLFSVGRLDKDTEGLLLITNDGVFCQELMHPSCHVEKKYLFYAKGQLTDEDVHRIENGVIINEGSKKTSKSKLDIIQCDILSKISDSFDTLRYDPVVTVGYLTISEGRKHQVKRMLMSVGCRVIYLKRVMIGQLTLDESIPKGEYRELTAEELNLIYPQTH